MRQRQPTITWVWFYSVNILLKPHIKLVFNNSATNQTIDSPFSLRVVLRIWKLLPFQLHHDSRLQKSKPMPAEQSSLWACDWLYWYLFIKSLAKNWHFIQSKPIYNSNMWSGSAVNAYCHQMFSLLPFISNCRMCQCSGGGGLRYIQTIQWSKDRFDLNI